MIVSGLMALTAMGASIIADVDPMTVVLRGGVAFGCGLLVTGIWSSVVNPQNAAEKPKKKPKAEPTEVESKVNSEPESDVEEAA
jgi:hypothetical protein